MNYVISEFSTKYIVSFRLNKSVLILVVRLLYNLLCPPDTMEEKAGSFNAE